METKKVLIIDDEPTFTRMVKLNLEKTGKFEVAEENDATRAITTAQSFKPDLVLLDVVMPGCDGGEVLAQIRGDGGLAKVPVIFLTATMSPDAMKARSGTIAGYPVLVKPIEAKQLVKQVEKTLAGAR